MESKNNETLKSLFEERIRTRSELSGCITQKMVLAAVLFVVSILSFKLGFEGIYWLLYFIPIFAVCYDLFFMSADLRIKRIGVFLGMRHMPLAGEAEKQWEDFCLSYQDGGITSFANMVFSCLITLASGVFIHYLQSPLMRESNLLFAVWLVISLLVIVALWVRHYKIIKRMLAEPAFNDFNNQFDQIQPLSV